MTHRRTLLGALALSTALAVSACAAEAAYTAPANAVAYQCYYDLSDECAPYIYGPPVVYGYGDLHHFDHFHEHPMHVVHGLGAFGGHGFAGHGLGGHGFASHGGFGFGGHGGVGRG
jgi:hypothetical protein